MRAKAQQFLAVLLVSSLVLGSLPVSACSSPFASCNPAAPCHGGHAAAFSSGDDASAAPALPTCCQKNRTGQAQRPAPKPCQCRPHQQNATVATPDPDVRPRSSHLDQGLPLSTARGTCLTELSRTRPCTTSAAGSLPVYLLVTCLRC
jgi:hypothetical protein